MTLFIEEQVDIVDERNRVLYQTSKQEAHEKGLLHRCIIAEVIDGEGKWTLVKQAYDRQDAGQYVSPVGGHVRAGESETDVLKREALEELGLTDFTDKYIGKAIYNRFVKKRSESHFFILYEIYPCSAGIQNHPHTKLRRSGHSLLHQ